MKRLMARRDRGVGRCGVDDSGRAGAAAERCSFLRPVALAISAMLAWTVHMPLPAQEQWPEEDLAASTSAVSEGELRFLAQTPAKAVHRHYNHIVISERALKDGWVVLSQCHYNLDPVGSSEIVYHPGRIRGLGVTFARNIERVWVEGASVQLSGVKKNAELCVGAESLALEALPDGGYSLRNGPYMRRFLDGYYPMQVFMDVHVPSGLLALKTHSPSTDNGLRVWQSPYGVHVSALFEGRLFTDLRFCRPGDEGCMRAAPPLLQLP